MHNSDWIVGKSGDGECFGRWGEERGEACVQRLDVWGGDEGGMEDNEGTVLTRKHIRLQFTRLLSRCRDVGGDAGERMRGRNGAHAGDARDNAGEE